MQKYHNKIGKCKTINPPFYNFCHCANQRSLNQSLLLLISSLVVVNTKIIKIFYAQLNQGWLILDSLKSFRIIHLLYNLPTNQSYCYLFVVIIYQSSVDLMSRLNMSCCFKQHKYVILWVSAENDNSLLLFKDYFCSLPYLYTYPE